MYVCMCVSFQYTPGGGTTTYKYFITTVKNRLYVMSLMIYVLGGLQLMYLMSAYIGLKLFKFHVNVYFVSTYSYFQSSYPRP